MPEVTTTRAYFNVQLMTMCAVVKWNYAVVVVNFEQEQWKSVETNCWKVWHFDWKKLVVQL